ncbi:aldehyde dehydrogenase family protein [Pseudonocardia halophobica]|uniref:Aldehyde dehydrogenase n=1 Tax=Pseudonocardia halophobica TaxID=29401 RepID=A0A9W6NUP8_9PSEU|nr:aldehyde dehydrogenase family protein [Pseudonocardia halophobica]GLL10510.1 aldehyde dehydrogenase [Pseudonocardia halophobica]
MSVIDARHDAALPVDPPDEALRALLGRQRAAFLAEGPPDLETRLDRIDRFVLAVLESAEDITAALDADFGSRPRAASLTTDVAGLIPVAALVRENLASWMRDEEVPGSAEAGTPTFVQVRPKGVVGVVGPWNFPVSLVAVPAIEALAAGNRVMIKVSEVPERTAEVLAHAVARRLSPDEVVVVRGGVTTASAFSALEFDHLIFTGSPGVGAKVAEAAGRNLVPVTLELGGKNPVVLGADADLDVAAERVAGARLTNGGQLCLCPDLVYVPRARFDDFVARLEAAFRAQFPTYAEHPAVVSIVDERNFDRVTALVADAEAKGAEVHRIVPAEELVRLPDRATRRIAPTVLLGVTPDMDVASEEIFGPVIAVHPYDGLDAVIDDLNGRPSPLAAYWFGSDGPEFRRFLDRTTSGGVSRNDLILHWSIVGAPSGGVGRSGMGAYTGEIGFREFSHLRTVAANTGPEGMATRLVASTDPGAADGLAAAIHRTAQEIRSRLGE